MKNIIASMAVVAFLFSVNTNAQAQEPVQNKKKAKTEQSCCSNTKSASNDKKSCCSEGKSNGSEGKSCSSEAKSCGNDKKAANNEKKSGKKGGCCSAKKIADIKA